ncbi:MAG: bifunctional glycosyltransferase family 2/GtrA family protein [Pseudomonadota bacterium]
MTKGNISFIPELQSVAVIIPAYNPDAMLVRLVEQLQDVGFARIIVVDDGSNAAHIQILSELSGHAKVIVLKHVVNCGKGRALKTAFNHCLTYHPELAGVITVDADGQHRLPDIVNVASEMLAKNHIVLGVRQFGAGVPLRSRVGNIITSKLFALLYGRAITDTQTGLRAFPLKELPELVTIGGERYEYESGVLASVISRHIAICELPIETIYIDGNRSSHFNPIIDSMRIYFVLIRYVSSSVLTAAIDFVVFAVILQLLDSIVAALIVGRSAALSVNFLINKKYVFRCRLNVYSVFLRYLALLALIAVMSYLMICEMKLVFGIPPLIAKLIAESILFILSFTVQRDIVFANHRVEQSVDEQN